MRLAAFFITLLVVTAISADAPATSRPEDILNFLNQTVAWHRVLGDRQSLMNQPSDAIFLNENRQIADQVAIVGVVEQLGQPGLHVFHGPNDDGRWGEKELHM